MRKASILLLCIILVLTTQVSLSKSYVCGTTTTRLNVRTHFELWAHIITVLEKDISVCFVARAETPTGQWGLIEDVNGGGFGWVSLRYVHMVSDIKNFKEVALITDSEPHILSSEDLTSPCLQSELPVSQGVKYPLIWVVNLQKANLTVSQLERIDKVVASIMNVRQLPVMYWFTGSSAADIDSFVPDLEAFSGEAIPYGLEWDTCHLNKIQGVRVGLAAIRLLDDSSWNFGAIVHERAHTLGAIHGLSANVLGFPEEVEINSSGPMDAFWWSVVAASSWNNTCVYDFNDDPTSLSVCISLRDIVDHP